MKKSGSKSKRKLSTNSQRRLSGIENLEDRRVLAANVLASGTSSLLANTTQDVTLTVATPDAAANAEAVLAIEVAATPGSTIDPGAITILDSNGNAVATNFSDANADGTSSQAIASLPAGVFTLQISGENGSAGSYEVGVTLPGDVNASDGTVGAVSAAEVTAAQLAFSQTFGTGNFVTDLFNRVHGLDPGGSFDTGFDTNGDGALTAADIAVIQQNAQLGTVNATLVFDSEGPSIGNIVLVSDTGTSGADGITATPDLQADISDNSEITSVTASINGGAAVDIGSLVGDFNTTGSFSLDSADLAVINGGAALPDGPTTISFVGTDALGNVSSPVTFDFVLITNNVAPTTTGVADQTTAEDAAFSFDVSSAFSDLNAGDVLTYSATGLPAWLSLDTATGLLSGTPLNSDVGASTINLTALDSQGGSVSDSFVLTVTNVNDAPELVGAIGTQAADEDDPFTLDLNSFFADEDGDALSFTAVQTTGFDAAGNPTNSLPLPAWLTLTNGVLSGTPDDTDIGSFTVGVTVTDPSGALTNELFSINVTNLNDAPTLVAAIADQTATEDVAFSLDVNSAFADADPGDSLTITASGLPAAFSINNGVISGTPDDAAVGLQTVTVTATDLFGTSISDTFDLTIANVNDVPVATGASVVIDPSSAANGTSVATVVATDADVADSLAFAITSGNANGAFAIDPATGEITIADSTQLVDGASETLTVSVTDNAGASDTATVTVDVTSNFAPTAVDDASPSVLDTETLSIGTASLVANDTDPDGDTLSVSAVSGTSAQGATVVLSGGTITYNPSVSPTLASLGDGESLTDTFTYTVSDGNGGTDTATVSVLVNGVDLAEYRLEVLDVNGNVTTTVAAGGTFTLVAFAEDLAANAGGVFAGFLDVNYAGAVITPTGPIVPGANFSQALNGTNTTPGLLDEVGGIGSLTPQGPGEFEVFRQDFIAGPTAGTVTFTSDEPEDQSQRQTLVHGSNAGIPVEQIEFGSTTLTITGAAATAGAVVNQSVEWQFSRHCRYGCEWRWSGDSD